MHELDFQFSDLTENQIDEGKVDYVAADIQQVVQLLGFRRS